MDTSPNEIVGIDLPSPYTHSASGKYRFFQVVVDRFFKWTEIVPFVEIQPKRLLKPLHRTMFYGMGHWRKLLVKTVSSLACLYRGSRHRYNDITQEIFYLESL